MFRTTVTWIDARQSLPKDGDLVLAAIVARAEQAHGRDVWLVLPTHFRRHHRDDASGQELNDLFIDADRVLRSPDLPEAHTAERVTHWAELPALPGTESLELQGRDALDALLRARQG